MTAEMAGRAAEGRAVAWMPWACRGQCAAALLGNSCRSRVPAQHAAWHGGGLFWEPTNVQLLLHLALPVAYLQQRMHLDAQLPWLCGSPFRFDVLFPAPRGGVCGGGGVVVAAPSYRSTPLVMRVPTFVPGVDP